ncbi:MAG: helix-turn-helix domain-containing protein [Armatimonadota bacterium]
MLPGCLRYNADKYQREHDDHEIQVILHGAGDFIFPDRPPLTVHAGQVVFLPSGYPHSFSAAAEVRMFGCHLHPDAFRRLNGKYTPDGLFNALSSIAAGLVPCATNHPGMYQSLRELFEQGMHEYSMNDPLLRDYQRALSSLIAINLYRMCQSKPETQIVESLTHRRVLEVKAWMERHFAEELTLATLAEKAFLSPSYFSQLFKEVAGLSPKAYLIRCRLMHAAALLRETDHSIAYVASVTGFSYHANFTEAFTAQFSLPPTDYRKKHKEHTGFYES